MSTNSELQILFEHLAAGIELLGGNRFRATSYERVARLLRDLTKDVRAFVDDEPASAQRRLQELPGIGEGAARRILEYLEHGTIAEHKELLEKVPAGVFDLLNVPGLGPKAVKTLWQELGITSEGDLRAALDQGLIEGLPRMGKKTADNLRRNLAFSSKQHDRVRIGLAYPLARQIVERLSTAEGVSEAAFAGSLRRGRDTVGDLDFLACTAQPDPVRQVFLDMPEVVRVLAAGDTKCSVRLHQPGNPGVDIQADLRIIPRSSWGAALLYFTGSKEHNVRLREIAVRKGWRLNEYGLFEGTEERPQDRGQKPLVAKTETAIYKRLALPFIAPELREDRGEIQNPPKGLLELSDIHSELHSHTTASDGKLELEELVALARARGYRVLAITDHSSSSVLANGLDPKRLARHARAIRKLDQQMDDMRLLAGAEVDILPDGSLDYEDAILADLDWVIASPHASLQQSPQQATDRLLRAIDNPYVHLIGHPTGRKVGRRAGLEPDLERVFDRAARAGVALEINANPARLDLCAEHVRAALAHGCSIAVNTDAHIGRHFDYLHYGVTTARRGWLTRDCCLNTWTPERLDQWRLGGRRRS